MHMRYEVFIFYFIYGDNCPCLEGLALPSGINLQTRVSDAWSLLEWARQKALQNAQTYFTGK